MASPQVTPADDFLKLSPEAQGIVLNKLGKPDTAITDFSGLSPEAKGLVAQKLFEPKQPTFTTKTFGMESPPMTALPPVQPPPKPSYITDEANQALQGTGITVKPPAQPVKPQYSYADIPHPLARFGAGMIEGAAGQAPSTREAILQVLNPGMTGQPAGMPTPPSASIHDVGDVVQNFTGINPVEPALRAIHGDIPGAIGEAATQYAQLKGGQKMSGGLQKGVNKAGEVAGRVNEAAIQPTVESAALGAKTALNVGRRMAGLPEAPLSPEQAATKALKPRNSIQQWKQTLGSALPDARAAADQLKIDPSTMTLDDAMTSVTTAKKGIWKQYQDMLGPNAKAVVDGNVVADAMEGTITKRFEEQNPQAAAAIREKAQRYRRDIPLDEAEDYMQDVNNELASYYAKHKVNQRVASRDSATGNVVAEGNALRNALTSKLSELTGQDAAGIRKRYGALTTLEDVIQRRQNVFERQQPDSLNEQVSKVRAAGKIARGVVTSPMLLKGSLYPLGDIAEGVRDLAAARSIKKNNDTNSLIQRAFSGTQPRGGLPFVPPNEGPAPMSGGGLPFLPSPSGAGVEANMAAARKAVPSTSNLPESAQRQMATTDVNANQHQATYLMDFLRDLQQKNETGVPPEVAAKFGVQPDQVESPVGNLKPSDLDYGAMSLFGSENYAGLSDAQKAAVVRSLTPTRIGSSVATPEGQQEVITGEKTPQTINAEPALPFLPRNEVSPERRASTRIVNEATQQAEKADQKATARKEQPKAKAAAAGAESSSNLPAFLGGASNSNVKSLPSTFAEFAKDAKQTSVGFAKDLAPQFWKSAKSAKAEPFMDGKFELRRGDNAYTVLDKGKPIASFGLGNIVVDKAYRKQGIGTELATQFLRDHPDYRPESLTSASRRIFEKAFERAKRSGK